MVKLITKMNIKIDLSLKSLRIYFQIQFLTKVQIKKIITPFVFSSFLGNELVGFK